MSVQRAIGVAVLAAAGCVGLYFASKSGSLDSWGLPYLEPWQVLTIVAWTINTAVIAAGGRLDANTMAVDTGKDAKEQLPEARYFLPAGWAFAIWGPIILGELALAVYQALPIDSVDDATGWLSQLSPWLAAAFLFQVCWCLSFREWAKDSGLLWFPAVMLFGAAVCLGGAHRVLRAALSDGSIDTLEYFLVHLPVSLHFGWVSCATLVNFNTHIGFVSRFSDKGKLRLSLLSIAAAMCLAIAITGITGDSIYAFVVAWALAAIANNGDRFIVKPETEDTVPSTTTTRPNPSSPLLPGESESGVVISALKAQTLAAKTATVICLITGFVTPFV